MRNLLKILLFGILFLSFYSDGLANPLSNIFSVFQRDLAVHVLYQDHRNLIQGSEVYLAEDPNGQKVLIGEVKKISLVESQKSNVELVIDKKYKEEIYETTRFVLMSGLFADNSKPHIVAVSSLNKSPRTPMKSGTSVKGVTFLEYRMAEAAEDFKKMIDSFRNQNDALLKELEQYMESFDTEAFQKQMDALIDDISKFSAEQKEAFEKDVLPALRKAIESMMEKLEKQNDSEKSKELENQLIEIENMVNV